MFDHFANHPVRKLTIGVDLDMGQSVKRGAGREKLMDLREGVLRRGQ
jgi:hypothetical protein